MRLSAKAEYACLAMVALASRDTQGPPARIREIAESYAIPGRYLVQILLRLKAAGLVQSVRGASGGYRLARPASRINLAEVLEAIDGPDEVPRPSTQVAGHVLGPLWAKVRDAQWQVLRDVSLDTLAERSLALEWVI